MSISYHQLFDEVDSIHEAGHAAMAIALGMEVVEVVLVKKARGGFGHCHRRGLPLPMTEVTIRLAGPGAQRRHGATLRRVA